MSCSRTTIAVLCALALCAPVGARAAEPGGPTAPGSRSVTRVLVRFASDASPAQRAKMRARADVERDASLAVHGLEVVDPEPGVSVGAAVADLERMDGVLYAEPDRVVRQTATPTTRCSPPSGGWPPSARRRRGTSRPDPRRCRRRGRHGDRRDPPGSQAQPVDEPGRVGRRPRTNGLDDDGNGSSTTSTAGTSSTATRSPTTAMGTAPTSRARSRRGATTASGWRA